MRTDTTPRPAPMPLACPLLQAEHTVTHVPMLAIVAALALATFGTACGTSPTARLHRLELTARSGPPAVLETVPAGQVWEVSPQVGLPEYLDRDALLLDAGGGHVGPLGHERWAEPLRDAVPRLLLHDLSVLRGHAATWPAPAPAAARPHQRLRVDLLALQARGGAQASAVELRARWTLLTLHTAATTPGAQPEAARSGLVDLSVPLPDTQPASVVQAHRQALWQMAQAVVAAAR